MTFCGSTGGDDGMKIRAITYHVVMSVDKRQEELPDLDYQQ